jgi:hypothetical protein
MKDTNELWEEHMERRLLTIEPPDIQGRIMQKKSTTIEYYWHEIEKEWRPYKVICDGKEDAPNFVAVAESETYNKVLGR